MTGSWLIVKWAGMAVLALYLVLLLVAVWQFRGMLSRLPVKIVVPIVLGNFIGLSLPSIIESVAVTRVCFVVAHIIYVYGIAILTQQLAQKSREGLLKADS
jgi:prepilin signal peptidase PulO-like enzyme (type II secretory pathway)